MGRRSGFVAGCGEPRPEGMPERCRAIVTVTQYGNAFSAATVTLYSDDASQRRV